jgi:hypothetical protein
LSRIHGRNGVAYVSVDGIGGANPVASPMAFLSDWSINFTVAKVDVTAMLDTNLIYVAGLPDASGDFTGFYDTATAQTYVAAVDGLPRNFYLYPSNLASQMSPVPQYFFGTILPDYSLSGGVTAAVSLKSTWNAASRISRYPTYGLPGT